MDKKGLPTNGKFIHRLMMGADILKGHLKERFVTGQNLKLQIERDFLYNNKMLRLFSFKL